MTASTYAVVDCAADPALYEHVARLEPQHAICLYEGRLDPQVRAVSPFVVQLHDSDPLRGLWVTRGWGRAWGMILSSRAGLEVVRRRLRRFTLAKLPDGSGPVLFRFWDPRVFRTYFPLVEPEALGDWFADIDAYMVESEDGARILRFQRGPNGVVVQSAQRPAA